MSVKIPDSSLAHWESVLKPSAPSVEVAEHARDMHKHFIMALMFSTAAGLAIPSFTSNWAAILSLLILTVAIACAIGGADWSSIMDLLFQWSPPAPRNPMIEKVRSRLRDAEEDVKRLQAQYDREAGNKRWKAKWDDLRTQKETYENLKQVRQARLQALEAEARKNQLGEFLDQYQIKDADLKGIGASLKTILFLNGVETAADLNEDVEQIPSIGRVRAKWLLEWRRDLEKQFVFDPSRGVSPEARIKIEREIDALRFRLESELIGGAHYLRNLKQEIETSREKLQPVLTQARQELAQAEKDMEVAGKRNSAGKILITLIIALFIGLAIAPRPKFVFKPSPRISAPSESSQGPPPPPFPRKAL